MPTTESLLAANQAFYEAFERRDLDAMSDLWSHGGHVICTHPGWRPQRGWGSVASTWFTIFQNDEQIQVILTEVHAVVRGEVGWVSLDENLISGVEANTVSALNIFEWEDGRWQMVAHQASAARR